MLSPSALPGAVLPSGRQVWGTSPLLSSPQEEPPYLARNWGITDSCKEGTQWRRTSVTTWYKPETDATLSRALRKPRQSKLPELIQLRPGKSETGDKEDLSEFPSITWFFLKTGTHSPREWACSLPGSQDRSVPAPPRHHPYLRLPGPDAVKTASQPQPAQTRCPPSQSGGSSSCSLLDSERLENR